jgi:REP element-mobilizing transposase RayT
VATEGYAWLSSHGLTNAEQLHELASDLQHEFQSTFTKVWHDWLDAGLGECYLSRADARDLLIQRLLEEESLDAWVIMPNHLHALLAPKGRTLGKVLQAWKGGSAFAINQLLNRQGSLWQKEAYDHIVRSDAQWQHYRHYITENAIKAKLLPEKYAVGVGGQVFDSAQQMKAWLQ